MSVNTGEKVAFANPFSVPNKQKPSDYGSVEVYAQNVTPMEFGFHCINEAIVVAQDRRYASECMSHTAMGVLYFAVRNNPYLLAAKDKRTELDDVLFDMEENADAVALLNVLLETRKAFHKH